MFTDKHSQMIKYNMVNKLLLKQSYELRLHTKTRVKKAKKANVFMHFYLRQHEIKVKLFNSITNISKALNVH